MRNRIFEIVAFLIDYTQGDMGRLSETDDLWATLEAEGYSDDEISSAYSWLLKRADNTPQQLFSALPKRHSSHRVLNASERSQLTTGAYGFLIKLVNLSLIDDEQFETIMERVSIFGPKPVALDQIKFIASSVAFSDLDELDGLSLFDANGDLSSFLN